MGTMDSRALQKAISSKHFAASYYISGEDEHRKDLLVQRLISAAVDPATKDFNLDLLRGAEVDAQALDSMLQTLPMMAERRVIVVRDTGSLRKDARAVLEKYVTAPAPTTLLVLVALAGTKEEKEFANATGVLLQPPTGERLDAWIREHLDEVHGSTITDGALELLHSALSKDTVFVASELDKLASYVQGGTIDEEAVSNVVGVQKGKTAGDLLDAVAERDAAKALSLVEDVLSHPRNNAVTIIMALTVQTLAFLWGNNARGRVDYFALLKETGAFPMRSWGEAAKCWAKNQSRWDSRSLRNAMRALSDADQAAKDTRVASDEQLLSTLICAMCAPQSRAAA